MPQTHRLVEVTVLGHQYPVRVPDTDAAEQRVRDAARLLSERMGGIADATGEAGGLHLAVMAGLSLADDLLEARWASLREDDAKGEAKLDGRLGAELRSERGADAGDATADDGDPASAAGAARSRSATRSRH